MRPKLLRRSSFFKESLFFLVMISFGGNLLEEFLFCSRVHGDDDDLPGEGIGGCAFQMLVYCRSLVGVACNLR